MSYKICPDCGERVYRLGCVNCNELDYIEEQMYTERLPYTLDDADGTGPSQDE